MLTPDQIYEAIRVLPVHERLGLLERVAHDLKEGAAKASRANTAGGVDPIGAWADDAGLVDEVTEEIMQRREQHNQRAFDRARDP